MGMEKLERVGEEYTGKTELTSHLNVKDVLRHVMRSGKAAAGGAVKRAVRSCVLLLMITLLCGLVESLRKGTGEVGLPVTALVACLAVTAVAVMDLDSLLRMGEDAVFRMETLGDVLLPAVSMATAASGAPAAAAKQAATILFSDFLIRLIHRLLLPMTYAFLAVQVACCALGNDGLKRIGGLLKWMMTTILSVLLLAFVGYLNLSGVISGSVDASAVKAAKFTISNLVPVVGGVISDTAETLLAGAAVLRNAAGVFGMLAVLGICVAPFLNMGVHYLAYKATAALAATVTGEGRVNQLIDAIGTAFGMVLAMTGACGVLLIVAMISAVSTVSG